MYVNHGIRQVYSMSRLLQNLMRIWVENEIGSSKEVDRSRPANSSLMQPESGHQSFIIPPEEAECET